MNPQTARLTILKIGAVLFVFAALYHSVGFFCPNFVAPSPRWRHCVFVGVDLCGVWLILRRPAWALIPFGIVTVQQLYSHGMRGYHWWIAGRRIDWISIGVILMLPLVFCLLVIDIREKYARHTKNPKIPYI
jgi:hypothetical protein